MSKKILILTGDYTEEFEAMVPYQALSLLGYTVDVVCPEKKAGDTIYTSIHEGRGAQTYTETRGHDFMLTADFDSVNTADYCGLFITGGRAPEYLRLFPRVLEIVREFFADNKPVAAICHASQILCTAGVMKGYRSACFPATGPEVEMAGGTYVSVGFDEAIVDRNLCTAPAWAANTAILREFIKLLGVTITL